MPVLPGLRLDEALPILVGHLRRLLFSRQRPATTPHPVQVGGRTGEHAPVLLGQHRPQVEQASLHFPGRWS
ncbi:MAG: hypothetical protein U0797_09995 [Gemmataceae bacterium]